MLMAWVDYFQRVVVLNLPNRKDRLERTTEIMNDYGINFEVYEAIRYEPGFMGLVMTMQKLFRECLLLGIDRLLVFEDDIEFCHQPDVVNDTMGKCVEWMKCGEWRIFYLGLQHVRPFRGFITPNVLPVNCGYSTHAVAYGGHAMQTISEHTINAPIDNWIVQHYQEKNGCFCTYPLLATQRPGFSDIGGNHCDWNMYIDKTYNESIHRMAIKRAKF